MHRKNHIIPFRLTPALALVLLAALLASLGGCLHLRESLERPISLDLPGIGPAAKPLTDSAHRVLLVGAWLLTLGGLVYGLGRMHRAWREAGRGMPLDREDMALLRTARDAIGFLVRKQMGRLKAVSLAGYRRRQGP